jgi:hypothetical protein
VHLCHILYDVNIQGEERHQQLNLCISFNFLSNETNSLYMNIMVKVFQVLSTALTRTNIIIDIVVLSLRGIILKFVATVTQRKLPFGRELPDCA